MRSLSPRRLCYGRLSRTGRRSQGCRGRSWRTPLPAPPPWQGRGYSVEICKLTVRRSMITSGREPCRQRRLPSLVRLGLLEKAIPHLSSGAIGGFSGTCSRSQQPCWHIYDHVCSHATTVSRRLFVCQSSTDGYSFRRVPMLPPAQRSVGSLSRSLTTISCVWLGTAFSGCLRLGFHVAGLHDPPPAPLAVGRMGTPMERAGGGVGKDRNGHRTVQT